MDLKSLVRSLSPLERQILPHIVDDCTSHELIKKSGKKDIEISRALQWLENKQLITTKKEEEQYIVLGETGKKALKSGMPEKIFLKSITKSHASLPDIEKAAKFDKQELNAVFGRLRKQNFVSMDKGIVSITPAGKNYLETVSPEEKLLETLEEGDLPAHHLTKEQKTAYDELKQRKQFLEQKTEKIIFIQLTAIGKKLQKEKLDIEVVEKLTPEMIKKGTWKGKDFRTFDVETDVPKISGGKRHFKKQAIDYSRRIWLDMGFKEMTGSFIQTSFWNFDALFTPQDHPAREMQDTFFIGNPNKGTLPAKKFVDAVRNAHETGGNTGSTGWKYTWDPKQAMLNVLRTHTTCLSSQTLAQLKKSDLPAKYFALGRVFRNEAVDWSHLFEFNQMEGIVIDPNGNFRNLLGYLKQFFKKMGFPDARFRPANFPYTEPSVEVDVYHPEKKKWIELGGAGIFRPEVVVPLLGEDIPVLAWGLGIGRILMDYYGLQDVRDLYNNDLEQLKTLGVFLK